MGVYDHTKAMIVKSELIPKGILTDFCAAFFAAFFMSVAVTPFDIIRATLINQPPDRKIYKNFLDCAIKMHKERGVMSFYAGFIPIWRRFTPTTCLQLVPFEQLKTIFGIED